MISILYICTPNSIHDQKWITYFSQQPDKYKTYVVAENNVSEETKQLLFSKEIIILEPLSPISIRHPFNFLRSVQKLRKYIQEYKIDVVHILFATPYALWLNFIQTPSVITTRGSDVLVVLPELLKTKGAKGYYFKFVFSRFIKSFNNAKYITCTSYKQKDKVKELFGRTDVKLIRTGVNVDDINKLNKPELIYIELKNKKYILSPRFMSPIYNINYQIRSLEFLADAIIQEYVFVFIRGKIFDNDYFQKQIQILERYKKEKKLQYLIIDYLSQEELWMHIKQANLVWMTPISDGTPNSALETMAAKTPLIISDLSIYDPEIFDNSCIKTPLNNERQLATLVTDCLLNYNPQLIENGFNAVNEYGNRLKEMQKLEELYLAEP